MDDSLKQILAAQFAKLPKAVQNAITSADVEKEMRTLAERHKLHLDQWQLLENEVFMAILGIKPAGDIVANIKQEVGVPEEAAREIVADITKIVFSPIREELERELGAPQARDEEKTDVEKLREQVLAEEGAGKEQALGMRQEELGGGEAGNTQQAIERPTGPPTPGTPPPSKEKVVRAPASGAYVPGETSAARASVVDDPYRESPI